MKDIKVTPVFPISNEEFEKMYPGQRLPFAPNKDKPPCYESNKCVRCSSDEDDLCDQGSIRMILSTPEPPWIKAIADKLKSSGNRRARYNKLEENQKAISDISGESK